MSCRRVARQVRVPVPAGAVCRTLLRALHFGMHLNAPLSTSSAVVVVPCRPASLRLPDIGSSLVKEADLLMRFEVEGLEDETHRRRLSEDVSHRMIRTLRGQPLTSPDVVFRVVQARFLPGKTT